MYCEKKFLQNNLPFLYKDRYSIHGFMFKYNRIRLSLASQNTSAFIILKFGDLVAVTLLSYGSNPVNHPGTACTMVYFLHLGQM